MYDKNPLVSVIVPCFNQAAFLDDALQSVLDQVYTNWECIIINDGSTDNTKTKSEYWTKLDARFGYLEQVNYGVSTARNNGIKTAKGSYILPLDADDKIGKDYLHQAVKAFIQNKNLKLVYCKAAKFGAISGAWNLKPFSRFNLAISNIIFSSALFKRDDWQKIGGYDKNMTQGLEDWEFWIHLLKYGGDVVQLNKVGFYYRIKDDSRNRQVTANDKKLLKEYLSVKHADFFVEQLGSFHAYMYQGIEENKNLKSELRSRKHALKILFSPIINFFKLKGF
ncbi:glycosyltransferase family A protein [Aestuariivivens sp. NBU2969]|uniref:glycosyltransferase family 2 protein n=1 Tax=Aestuariivivens sp. NBU2969 TaxID=2873267 RepID=UPI001CBCA434|nr:glycosyltransferase family A protein [Aestuariivivens sp. NBU2969]